MSTGKNRKKVLIVGRMPQAGIDVLKKRDDVDYEILPAVLDHIEGMKSTTPKQWDNKLDGTTLDVSPPKPGPRDWPSVA